MIAVTSWQKALTYRTNTLLEVAGHFTTMVVSVALWQFAFRHTGQQEIGGYTVGELTAYLLIAGWITSSFWFTAQADRIVREIKEGFLSNYLTKPLRISLYQFFYGNAGKFMQFIMSFFVFIIVLLAFQLYTYLPLARFNVGAFLVFLLIAWCIQWLIFYTAALLSFWMEEVWGITFTIRVLADVAAGTFIPLSLFAPFWQNMFDLLPFKYIVSVPVNVLIGRVQSAELISLLMNALLWLAMLLLLAHIMMRWGIKRYSAVGG